MLNNLLELLPQSPWLKYLLEILLMTFAAWVLRRFVIAWLRRLAKRTETGFDDELVVLLNRALTPLIVLGLLAGAVNLFPLGDRLLAVLNRFLYLGILVAALYYSSKIFQLLLNRWLARTASSEEWREPVRFLTRVIFAAIGTMLLLDNLGISLTAVWTTLGVGSVAVALALQDTLSNFFAGVYLRLDSPVRLGDYVKLDSDSEGFVVQLGWRSTRIRTLPNNIIVVPNAKLASAQITNYSLPE